MTGAKDKESVQQNGCEVTALLYFALLVRHTQADVLHRQIANLRHYHPNGRIGLYPADEEAERIVQDLRNGSLQAAFAAAVEICPHRPPDPQSPNLQARFLYDMMSWLEQKGELYDYLVALAPEVLFVKKGYEDYLRREMGGCDYFFAEPFPAVQVYCHELVRRLLPRVESAHLEEQAAGVAAETEVETAKRLLFTTLFAQAGGTYRFDPARPKSEALATDAVVSLTEVLAANQQPDTYWVYPVSADPAHPALLWLTGLGAQRPRSLTITWGCYQGGMEAALQYRLRKLNEWGFPAHAYFYAGGAGLPHFQDIPYFFSPDKKDLVRYLALHRFDIVTFVNTLHNLEQLEAAGFQGNVFFELHGYEEGIVKELLTINERAEGGKITAVLVPSDHVAALARRFLSKRPDLPIRVVRNTLDAHLFRKRKSGTDWMIAHYPKLAKWAKTPLLGFVGRIDANKNWSLLLRVFRKVQAKFGDVKLLVVSDLTASPDLEDFFRTLFELDLFADVHLIGNLPHGKMPYFYSLIARSGGVLLSTSLSEGYPYHLLEAQACECPVVCTQIGGSMEVVEHGVNGYVFPVEKENQAVAFVLELLQNRELRKQFAMAGRQAILRDNDIERNVMQLAAWLSHLPLDET